MKPHLKHLKWSHFIPFQLVTDDEDIAANLVITKSNKTNHLSGNHCR